MGTAREGSDAASGLRWRLNEAPAEGSGTLVVVQSQVRVAAPRFGLERLFSATRHACLFLDCPDETWYRGCARATDTAIDAAVAATRPARIVHYGASKGAHGALATALRRRDGPVFAFGPELTIGAPGSRSAQAGAGPDPAGQAVDLAQALAAAAGAPPVTLVFGLHDPVDAAGHARLADLTLADSVRLIGLRAPHESHDQLYTLNIVRKLITRFDRDLATLCAERGLIAREPAAATRAFAAAGATLARGEPAMAARWVPDLLPDANPGHALLAGRIALALGRAGEAAGHAARAIALVEADAVLAGQPKRWRKEPWRLLIEAHGRAGDAAAARAAAAEARARFPQEAAFAP